MTESPTSPPSKSLDEALEATRLSFLSQGRRYYRSGRDEIEDVEGYRPGGFHPVAIGDVFSNGRYKVLHKLGFGGGSTVWLARDLESPGSDGSLVALKILDADNSSRPKDEIPELTVPTALDRILRDTGNTGGLHSFQLVKDHFTEQGPNGTHLCIVYQFYGPSVFTMSLRCKRLNGDLVRKVAKQLVSTVELMHSAGFVHGDLTTSNVLFHISDRVCKWSDDEVYATLGMPKTEEIRTLDSSPLAPHAPEKLIVPFDIARLTSPSLLQEKIVLIDFGQSFATNNQPKDYQPGTILYYQTPEDRFENKSSGTASDIWGLACTLFAIRAGCPLFDSFLGSDKEVLIETVQTLGKLPEPWWNAFEKRHIWFEEDGEPRPKEIQEAQSLFSSVKTSIYEELRKIGERDRERDRFLSSKDKGPMFEITGTKLEEKEVLLLGDLLEKMLKYRPEERITIQEVANHPWFSYTG